MMQTYIRCASFLAYKCLFCGLPVVRSLHYGGHGISVFKENNTKSSSVTYPDFFISYNAVCACILKLQNIQK